MSHEQIEAEITLQEAGLMPGGTATLRFRTTTQQPVVIRGAHVHFIGYEETQAVYTSYNGKNTTVHTATERAVLVEDAKTFQGRPPAGFFDNLVDGALTLVGMGENEELPAGTHDVVLKVALPGSVPESFEAKKAKLQYEAGIHLDIPMGRDFTHLVTLTHSPSPIGENLPPVPLLVRYPEDGGRGFFDSMFGPNVSVRVELSSTLVQRGTTLTGTVEVRFDGTASQVDALICQLVRKEKSEAGGHSDSHSEMIAHSRWSPRPGTEDSLVTMFEMQLPNEIIPSCSGAKFTIDWELVLALDVPWAKDPTVRIPIIVV